MNKNKKLRKNAVGASMKRRVLPSGDVILLLEHCDAAMTAAGSHLWDMNRDLALELNRRAARCRVMVGNLQNQKLSHDA